MTDDGLALEVERALHALRRRPRALRRLQSRLPDGKI